MKTTLVELETYLNTGGFWFVSNEELQGDCTKEAIDKGLIQPIENLGVGYPSENKSHFYVRSQLKSKSELPVSMHNHFVLGIGC